MASRDAARLRATDLDNAHTKRSDLDKTLAILNNYRRAWYSICDALACSPDAPTDVVVAKVEFYKAQRERALESKGGK